MPVLDTAMGGVGSGVQPKDATAPNLATPSAAAQTAANSLPPGSAAMPIGAPPAQGQAPGQDSSQGQMPMQPTSPQDQDQKKLDEELDAQLDKLAQKDKSKKVKDADELDSSQFDALLDKAAGTGSDTAEGQGAIVRKPGESSWAAAVRALPEGLRFTAAQMRAHLGRDPKEQRQAFESMYGPQNVKTQGNALYFRPDGEQKFRKVDEKLFGSMADFMVFNALNGAPLAANMAAQGVVDAKTGNPLAGGAAGGAADALVRQGLISGLNQVSNIPQDSDHVSLKKEILTDMGLNAVAPVGLKYLGEAAGAASKVPIVKQAVDKVYGALGQASQRAFNVAGEGVEKAAAIRNAFVEFRNAILPGIEQERPEVVGPKIGDAVDKIHDTLEKNVGVIKTEALALAKQKDMQVQMPATLDRLSKALQEYGYHIDPTTGLVSQYDDTARKKAVSAFRNAGFEVAPELAKAPVDEMEGSLVSAPMKTATSNLADFMNRIQREKYSGGSSLEDTFKYIDRLSSLSKFDKAAPANPDVLNLYRSIRNAAAQDRNAALDGLYTGSGLPNEKIWKNAFDKYYQNIDSIGDFKAAFHSPERRQLMVTALADSSTPNKLELLNATKQVLGQDSAEWNNLRGSIYSSFINKFSPHGELDGAGLASYMNQDANRPFIDAFLQTKERSALNRMAMEAEQLQKKGSGSFGEGIKKGLMVLVGMHESPASMVKDTMQILGGNAKAINYMADEGFLEMAQQAQGPALKRRILDSMNALDQARSKMKIIYPDKGVPIYVPIGGAALADAATSKLQGFNPQNAQPSPSPAPLQ